MRGTYDRKNQLKHVIDIAKTKRPWEYDYIINIKGQWL